MRGISSRCAASETAIAAVIAAVIACLAVPVGAVARQASPPPLSADRSSADVASTYGSGSFGRWIVDRFGLPAYRYDVDERVARRARQPELHGRTAAQHELGNDHDTAAAFNDGYTQLWSQDVLAQWANRFVPAARHYAGGYGYLNVGGRVLSTLYLDRPRGSALERRFGIDYYERQLHARGIEVREDVYAPFGNDPLLMHDVTIHNATDHPLRLSWFEYWDVNPFNQATHTPIGLSRPRWDAAGRTLSVTQTAGRSDGRAPMSIFAAALRGSVAGHETSVAAFFGAGTRATPAAVQS